MINYSGLSRPKSTAAPTDPIEIFKKTPNLGDAPNDLWKGQAEALSSWHASRKVEDNLIILNTGAGKSIVGVLVAQSLVNEEIGPVVYVCGTIDLVRQTVRECERIGIKQSTRTAGSFDNDLFETGKAFCITTYAALFSSLSPFRGEKAPAAILFDDAHVAERMIRDAFTITVQKRSHQDLFNELVGILRPEFDNVGKLAHLNFVLDDIGLRSVTMAPPASAYRNAQAIRDVFRNAKAGMFSLVSRVDGIDLPQDTCRIMLIDGAPAGSSSMERFLFDVLQMNNLFSMKLASRITQLFGRINRGRSDYGAFLVYGRDINVWLKNDRNIALLPDLLRKQVMLGQNLQKDIPKATQEQVVQLVNDVIDRKPDWLEYYRDTIDGLSLSKEVAEKVRDRETALAVGASAESDFMSALWNGDVVGARKAIIEVLNTVAVVDPKLAGWYSVWLGMTYEIEGDDDNANVHYTRARSRLTQRLNLPFRAVFESGAFKAQAQNDFHQKLLSVCNQGPQALADFVAKLRAEIDQLTRQDLSSNRHEESLRRVGERLGFNASRPDNDVNAGPDVIWSDEKTKTLIAFELKTKKETASEYSKADVGQCHNHIEWLRENFDGFTFDGLLVVGPEAPCSNQANPSADMWLATIAQLQNCIGRLCARIDDVRGGTAIACWTALNEMGQLAEWKLPGIQAQMRTKKLVDLKS